MRRLKLSSRRRPPQGRECEKPRGHRPEVKGAFTGLGRYREWLAQRSQEYAGQWVALRDGEVLGSDVSRAALEHRLEESAGLEGAIFLLVGDSS